MYLELWTMQDPQIAKYRVAPGLEPRTATKAPDVRRELGVDDERRGRLDPACVCDFPFPLLGWHVPAPPHSHLSPMGNKMIFKSPAYGNYGVGILPHWRQAPEKRIVPFGVAIGNHLGCRHIRLEQIFLHHLALAKHLPLFTCNPLSSPVAPKPGSTSTFTPGGLSTNPKTTTPTPGGPPLAEADAVRTPFTRKYLWRTDAPEESAARAAVQARLASIYAVAVVREKIQDAQFWAARTDIDADCTVIALELMTDSFIQAWGPRFSATRRAKRLRRLCRRTQEQMEAAQAHAAATAATNGGGPTPLDQVDDDKAVWGSGGGWSDGGGGWGASSWVGMLGTGWGTGGWGMLSAPLIPAPLQATGATWSWSTAAGRLLLGYDGDHLPHPRSRRRHLATPNAAGRRMGSFFHEPRCEPRHVDEFVRLKWRLERRIERRERERRRVYRCAKYNA
ncbi:hypothetical protein B0H14DRAFT_2637197 [Mycena olivaceomarginata]|nr:hypothetical protein B0H14DRAFT_2637197 [Mycena olivaceomarginata]